MDKMTNFGRMRSVKVQPKMSRTDMEARARMRAVGRQMKGVKLQYTADDRVFFDDVAGIGQAKVSHYILKFFGLWGAVARAMALCASKQYSAMSLQDGLPGQGRGTFMRMQIPLLRACQMFCKAERVFQFCSIIRAA